MPVREAVHLSLSGNPSYFWYEHNWYFYLQYNHCNGIAVDFVAVSLEII